MTEPLSGEEDLVANCCDCLTPPGDSDCGSEVVWGPELVNTTCSVMDSRELHCPWEEAKGNAQGRL